MSLLTDLVCYWKLDEASGTRYDSVGGMDLTDNNTVTQAGGKIGSAGQFVSANSEYLSRASEATLQTGDIDFTFCLWVYLDSNESTRFLLSKDDDTAGSREYGIAFSDGGSLKFNFAMFTAVDSGVNLAAALPAPPLNATWYFLVAWHDATANTINIRINDATTYSLGTGGSLQAAGSAQFRIGAREYAGSESYHDGRIDEVGFWKRVLTADEQTSLHNGGAGRTWPFSSGVRSMMAAKRRRVA
jgi:Concanavalin A-like lectin/glucanases superfamily